jgi:X-Pro dipeptidyl-peptidase
MRSIRSSVRAFAAVTIAAATVLSGATQATATPSPPGTQPVHDYAQAVRERVWVQTTVDSDADGRPDRVALRIIRPRASDGALKVPVILQGSPYFGGGNDVQNHDDIDRTGEGDRARRSAGAVSNRADTIVFSSYLDNYFVPRGYAYVEADSLGSGGSDGCPTSGGRNETLGMKAVVDWLNGRAPGFDETGAPVRAGWSTGRTGMIGVSYNGTLPNAVATTGVRGLETIVPIAAISSWYDYYRANGGVVAPGGFQGEDTDILAKYVLTRQNPEACAEVIAGLERDQDRITGDYSPYWNERNYVKDAGKIRASVFMVHGLHDDNVRTGQAGQWWEALTKQGVPRKVWWHQGTHTDPFSVRRAEWLSTLHRWFDQWLHRIDTGIMREPMADVEVAANQWRTSRTWPVPGAEPTALALGGPSTDGRPGTLRPWPAGPAGRQTFVDAPARTPDELVADEMTVDPNRLAYLSEPLRRPVRLSGTPTISVRADLTGKSPYLSALLVDYGTAERVVGQMRLEGEDCIAPGTAEDPGCFRRVGYRTVESPYEVVSRGWIDVRNRVSPSRTVPIEPGRPYTFSWDLQTDDHVFPPGHRIGVVLISTDRDHTLRYPAGTEVGVRLGVSKVVLPLARG